MRYDAFIHREGSRVLAEFPDCPGCQTFASSERALHARALEALEGWLETHLEHGEVPPLPRVHRGENMIQVSIDPSLAVRIQIRRARAASKLTQGDLAQRAGEDRWHGN